MSDFRRTGLTRRGILAAAALMPLARVASAQVPQGPIVTTASGKVQGLRDRGIHVFRGLPYGAPTGGANRFMPPKPPVRWAGVRQALTFGASSPQTAVDGPPLPWVLRSAVPLDPPGVAETEDCLMLNVWTPSVTGKRPVMVWFHGGGFSSGSDSALLYDGVSLARRGDVVIVGVNHRLNVFGFTHLAALGGRVASSGNAGILDLVAALQWVKTNIAAFGGDPGNVTIFGQSGGGAKVATLLAMPAAKGLFHKAIIQSGGGSPALDPGAAGKAAEMLGAELGIAPLSLAKLQRVPTAQLLKAYFAIQPKLSAAGLRGAFSPVLDGTTLPSQPFEPEGIARSSNIPVLIGSNRHEVTLFMMPSEKDVTLDNAKLLERVKAGFPKADAKALIDAYRAGNPGASPWDLLTIISSDRAFGLAAFEYAERKAALRAAPVFVYRWQWETAALGGRMRAMHGTDLAFVFDNTTFAAGLLGAPTGAEELAASVSGAWTAFARSGVPSAPKLPAWPAYTPDSRKVMLLDTKSSIADNPNAAERAALRKAM